MNIDFNRRKIETLTIFISFCLVLLLTFLGILAFADLIFKWDILPRGLEKVAILIMTSIGLTVGACFLLNLMVNISIISISFEKISDNFISKNKQDED